MYIVGWKREFFLPTGAIDTATSRCLIQKDEDGNYHLSALYPVDSTNMSKLRRTVSETCEPAGYVYRSTLEHMVST